MLQNVLGPPFGTAQPLWSLNWEWWSYMLAPFIVVLLLRLVAGKAVLSCIVLGAVCLAAGLGYVLLWHLGILLALIRFPYRVGLLCLAGLICIFVPVATRSMLVPSSVATQIIFLLSFVVLLSQLRHITLPSWMPNKQFAGFSYSVYLLHTTILVFLMALLQTHFSFPRQLQPSAPNFAKYLVLIIAVYVTAYAFALLTEANTGRLRWLVRKRLLGSFLRTENEIKSE